MKLKINHTFIIFFTIIYIICSCTTESTKQSKMGLYEVYITAKDYDSSKLEIPKLKIESDLIDSTELVSFFQGKAWTYSSFDEFEKVRLVSSYKYKNRHELNLVFLLKDQKNRDRYIARSYIVYTRRDTNWILSKHKILEIEPLDSILVVLKRDSIERLRSRK